MILETKDKKGFFSSGSTELAYVVSNVVHNMIKFYIERFKTHHFKHIHKTSAVPLREFKRKNILSVIKKTRPVLAINHRVNLKEQQLFDSYYFTRQMGIYGIDDKDLNQFSDCIIYDKEHGIRLNFTVNYVNINFDITQVYDTKMQQMESFWAMLPQFDLDPLQKEFYIKFPIPERYVYSIAEHMGMKSKEDKSVPNPLMFTSMLNKYTMYPVLYEFDTGTGKYRYFVTCKTIYLIKFNKPEMDDGERKGDLEENFKINHNIEVDVMAPNMFYLLYTDSKWHPQNIPEPNMNGNIAVSTIRYDWLPHILDDKRTLSGYSGYVFDEEGKTATIDLREIMMDDIYETYQKIESKGGRLSSLMTVKFYINSNIVDSSNTDLFDVDIDNYKITIKNGHIEDDYVIAMYVDLETIKQYTYEVFNETNEYLAKRD